jgi:FKBP-type peptidyl-prolyl cis-trans isomerase FklB
MKRTGILTVIVVMFGISSCTSFSHKTELKSDIDTMSFYFGLSRADGIKNILEHQSGIDTAYMDAFYKGLRDGAKKNNPEDLAYLEGVRIAQLIYNNWVKSLNMDVFSGDSGKTVNEKAILAGFYYGAKNANEQTIRNAQVLSSMKMEQIKEQYIQEKYAESIAANEKFLADNKNKEGVRTTESGLQYKILTEGNGPIPNEKSKVKVHYKGTLIDGAEFDSSDYKNNIPASFRANQVIKGWTEALTMMPVGSKWELYIPQHLGYGSKEQQLIPPYSTLIFEVELVQIESDGK